MASFKNISDAPRWVPALGRDVEPGGVIDDVGDERLEAYQPGIWERVEAQKAAPKKSAHK